MTYWWLFGGAEGEPCKPLIAPLSAAYPASKLFTRTLEIRANLSQCKSFLYWDAERQGMTVFSPLLLLDTSKPRNWNPQNRRRHFGPGVVT